MPTSIVTKLMDQVTELERKVAVLMSWHKVNTTILILVLGACVKLLWK